MTYGPQKQNGDRRLKTRESEFGSIYGRTFLCKDGINSCKKYDLRLMGDSGDARGDSGTVRHIESEALGWEEERTHT